MRITIILIALLTYFSCVVFAQCEGGDNTTQPTIMVVPVVKISGDILEAIENNSAYRQIIIELDNQFKSRDFETKNFVQTLKNIMREEGQNIYTGTQAEIDAVVERAGPDIWIQTEIMIVEHPDNPKKRSLAVSVQAIHRVSASNFASKIFEDDRYTYETNFGRRARKAMMIEEKVIDRATGLEKVQEKIFNFLDDLNYSFHKIRNEGMSFSLSIVCYQDAQVRLNIEVGDDFNELTDLISAFVREASYDSSPAAKPNSSTKLGWDNLKMPLKIKEDGECVNFNIKKHFINPLRKKINKEWAPQTDIKTIYPHVRNDGVGKWIITLCDSRDDCVGE